MVETVSYGRRQTPYDLSDRAISRLGYSERYEFVTGLCHRCNTPLDRCEDTGVVWYVCPKCDKGK